MPNECFEINKSFCQATGNHSNEENYNVQLRKLFLILQTKIIYFDTNLHGNNFKKNMITSFQAF